MDTISIVVAIAAAAAGYAGGWWWRTTLAKTAAGTVEQEAKRKKEEAEVEAKKLIVDAKDKASHILLEAEAAERERKQQNAAFESRLLKREELIDNKLSNLDRQEAAVSARDAELKKKESEVETKMAGLHAQLEKIAGLSVATAREQILRQAKEESKEELAASLQKLTKERSDEVEKRSLEIITTAMQRYARSHISELTTTTFPLKDEDMKGKIIGREGRNIRAIERATGVELIVDETPDTVVISSFDPLRREIARLALEKLVKDGRIQPAKIEEKVEEAKQEITKRMVEIGDAAAQEIGVYDLPKELIQLVGRLHFRTSFGQNVLTHSVEMAYVAGMLAAELGLDVTISKKAALLHDIGKAIDQEVEGTHVELGRKILKKYNVDERVIQAMQSHHDDYPYEIPEAFIVTTADILSAARPGARRGTLENYIKRLGDLEKIATSFTGVKNAYAISAGRELRVFVIPEKVDDFRALEMARDIANKIQSELRYPGEIKVNVIREMRAVEYAR